MQRTPLTVKRLGLAFPPWVPANPTVVDFPGASDRLYTASFTVTVRSCCSQRPAQPNRTAWSSGRSKTSVQPLMSIGPLFSIFSSAPNSAPMLALTVYVTRQPIVGLGEWVGGRVVV